MIDLSGKAAVVTGAAHGQGAASAATMAGLGASVVLADIDNASNAERAEEIQSSGGRALAVEADVRDEGQVADMIAAAVSEFGRLDVLHNNAADIAFLYEPGDPEITKFTVDQWREQVETMFLGPMLGCKYAIPAMIESGEGGSIITTSSCASVMGELNLTVYGAAKAALNQLARSVSTQWGKSGIRSNAIAPGLILTRNGVALGEELINAFIDHCDTPYVGQSQDIANLVAFLASDASRYITGQTIHIDGGFGHHNPMVADQRSSGVMVAGEGDARQ